MPLKFEKRTLAGLDVLEVPGDPQGSTILLFHGYGADAYDLLPLSTVARFDPKPTFLFPSAPLKIAITMDYTGRGWFPINTEKLKIALETKNSADIQSSFPENLEEVRALCLQIIAELNIPLSKLILGGFSQGALLAVDLALHLPEKVKGLVILSGILVQEELWKELALQKKGLPFFQSHGTQDPILPFNEAKALEQVLKKSGLQGELHSFPGGHDIPPAVLLKLYHFLQKI